MNAAICHRCNRAFVLGWQCVPIVLDEDGRSRICTTREVGHLCAACYAEPGRLERPISARLAQTQKGNDG